MNIREDYDLSHILWYRLGGRAKYLLEIAGREDLEEAICFLQEKNLYREKKYIIVGQGSNLIFTDDYYDGAILHFIPNKDKKRSFIRDDFDDTLITAYAGESLDDLIQFSFAQSLIGLEWAGGLPGTVGAAVRGNVGAFGGEVKDVFYDGEVASFMYDKPDYQKMNNTDMMFDYRQSIVKKNKDFIVLYATFKQQKANDEELAKAKKIYSQNIEYRKTHHPMEYPSCGSVFKNIKIPEEVEKILLVWPDIKELVENRWYGKVSMGYIIGRLGFSGKCRGNVQISTKHPNFIINKGNGNASDVISLIKEIQNKVKQTFSFVPEIEVEII